MTGCCSLFVRYELNQFSHSIPKIPKCSFILFVRDQGVVTNNESTPFINIKKYDTIQLTIIHIFQPYITHLDEGRYCRAISGRNPYWNFDSIESAITLMEDLFFKCKWEKARLIKQCKIYAFSINLLVVYRESVNLIGYITRRLSADIVNSCE